MKARFLLLPLLCLAAVLPPMLFAPSVVGSTELDLRLLSQNPRERIDAFPAFRYVHSGHGGIVMQQDDGYYHCEDGNWCSYTFTINHADAGADLRRLVFKRGADDRGNLSIMAAPYYAVRPIVVNRYGNPGLYYLGVGPDGRDLVRRLGNGEAGGYPLYPWGAYVDCRCNPCGRVDYTIHAESFTYGAGGPEYRPYGHQILGTRCVDVAVYGVMFDSYLISPIYQPFDCNDSVNIDFRVPSHGSLGFQCAGPVYRADGALIWPEACFSLGDMDGSGIFGQGYESLNRNRRNYTPFFFDVGTNTPIRIRDSGPVPTLRDFSHTIGTIRYRLLDEAGNPIGDWVAVNGRGVVMVPVGIDRIEIEPPPMVRLADRVPGRYSDTDYMKAFRAQIAVARLDTGKWDIAWDSGVVSGSGAPPNPPRFVLRGLADVRGSVVIRGVGGWWRNGARGILWYHWNRNWAYDGNPGFYIGWWRREWRHYGIYCQAIGLGGCWPPGDLTPIYNVGNAQAYLFDGGPKGASIYGPMGWEITGTAFQVFLTVVPYEVIPPDNMPAIRALALQEASGVASVGDSYGLPVDGFHRAGVRYLVPSVNATIVFTDEVGVQRVGVVLSTATITSTISHLGVANTARLEGSEIDHLLPQTFYVQERGVPPDDPALVVASPSSGASVSLSIQYRLYGDTTVWYRFADGTVQPIPLRVFLPRAGRYEQSGSIPITWLREER